MWNLMAPKKNYKLIEKAMVLKPTQTPNVLPKTSMDK
jgi:hypothetical protein